MSSIGGLLELILPEVCPVKDYGKAVERGQRAQQSAAIALGIWVIKILATTLGETGGDAVTMSWLGRKQLPVGRARDI